MVIRIFYVAIAIFSIAMVILSVQAPYLSEFFKNELEIASIEMEGIIDYEVNNEIILSSFEAQKGIRYSTRDEFFNFIGKNIDKDTNNTLTANKAIYKGDIITFIDNAIYLNSDNLQYKSDEIVYNSKEKTIKSDKPFVAMQDDKKVIGSSVIYDLNKKQTFAKGVNAWFSTKQD
ncbi:lipooligosaccharide transport system, periplasmic component LptC [Campylobacter blaseri]|uniref:LPS export ABC transporter periplasmic protein LptC n=1 Tax=Campylobacter blaseri TaxID=2042961 RepID=A0A2P8QZZ9_9BACT|nr:LPS export ABC transporter periplasmic protein LptC [Campylobacter blaseri]PSM51827.1 LPS export ABC transporter periplasmic protein LptC [Campylobacter blaseri]PSM53618.1 LPS export ABC transporter periplasmic protein LptC [Campylobacter blaseri]QKF86432.1 lipooligosaccharide transport system, periplasmic component LptC [Campylobacter blaseri]